MEILKLISENPGIIEHSYSALPALAIAGIGQAASGLIGAVGSMIGGRKRRREQRAANQKLQQRMGEYENFNFVNAYADMENPYEDLTVNTQQAEFQAQQQQQGLASTLDSLRQSGGGMGAAAIAQALAQQQAAGMQGISASIGQQESANARMAAQGAMQLQQAEAAGAMDVQQSEFGRTQTLLDMSAQRKTMADQARQQATSALFKGIGDIAGGAAQFGAGGGFAKAATPTTTG